MPLGNVEPFNLSIQKVNKSTSEQIALGKVCDINTALTPDGFKKAGAAAKGPFVVAVNKLYATTDTYFAGARAPSIVVCNAGGAIQPGWPVKTDTNGDVVAADVTSTAPDSGFAIVGVYLTKDGEINPAAAAQNDAVRIKLGGAT